MNSIKISIIVPSFNQGIFLEKTIESIITQTYSNYELIIIDGGSTDGSVNIMKKYSEYITYWCSEPDNGQTNAINKGMKLATGEVVAYLNSDDVYMPGTFEFVADKFTRDSDLDIAYGDCVIIDENDSRIALHKELPFNYLMGCFIGFGLLFSQPSTFWKRKIFDDIGYFNENNNFNMDGEFFSRAVISRKVKHFSKYLSKARFHESSKTVMNINNPSSQFVLEMISEVRNSYNRLWVSRVVPFDQSKLIRETYRTISRRIPRFFRGHYFCNYQYRKSII